MLPLPRTFAQHQTLEHNDTRKDPYLQEYFQDFASTCTMQMATRAVVGGPKMSRVLVGLEIAERVNGSLAYAPAPSQLS